MRVAICISTFHRAEGLQRVLDSIARLEEPAPPARISVLVVNNDPDDARPSAICAGLGRGFPYAISCIAESQRGLSAPRNRALDQAAEDHDFIAYIDDDSIAAPGWLARLLDVQRSTSADVVTGPVVPFFERPPPAWIVRGGFFASRDRPTGRRLGHAFTNNVLIRVAFLRETGLRFDARLALVGGEDTHFFRRLARLGGTIVWANDAVVEDLVPAERATARWLVRRHARTGMTTAAIERDLRSPFVAWPLVATKSLAWLALGGGLVAAGLLAGRATRVRGRCWLAWGGGLGAGLLGRARREYLEER